MKIGYIQTRANVFSLKDQTNALAKYGIRPEHIYSDNDADGFEEAIKSCYSKGDELVIWSAAVIGRVRYSSVIKRLAKVGAVLHILRRDLTIDCVPSLPAAQGLDDISQAEKMNGVLVGRKKKVSPEKAADIINYVNEGNLQSRAAEHFEVSTTAVSKIVNGGYFNEAGQDQ